MDYKLIRTLKKLFGSLLLVAVIVGMTPTILAQLGPIETYQDSACSSNGPGDICNVYEDINQNGICEEFEFQHMPKTLVDTLDLPVCSNL